MLRSRCLLPSPRSPPSSKLSPLCVPVSPISRPERCKPCPVALVPTLGCSRPLPPSLPLLASALSGNIIPGYVPCSSKNGPYIRTRLVTPQKKNKHTGSTTPTDAFAPASVSGRPRGGRAQVGLPLSNPCPRTHVEMRGRNGPGRPPPNPTLLIILLIIRSTCTLCSATTAAVAEASSVAGNFFTNKTTKLTKECKISSKYQNLKNNLGCSR